MDHTQNSVNVNNSMPKKSKPTAETFGTLQNAYEKPEAKLICGDCEHEMKADDEV